MHKGLRIALGFIVCSIVYVAGFITGILAVSLMCRFLFFLPEADGMSPIMGGAVCSNLSAILLFSRITGEENALSNIAFSIYLICIAAIFLLFFLVSMKGMFLLYAVVSIVMNRYIIYQAFKDRKTPTE